MSSTVFAESVRAKGENIMTTISRWLRRSTITVLGGTTLALAVPLAGYAHVEISADTTAAGSSAVLTLDVPHGCDGSPTRKLTLAVPSGITEVIPTVDAGWTVTKTTEKLAKPVTLDDGDQLTERTSQVVWTAGKPLPDGFRATLSLQVELPADAVGQTLAFPVVQTCVKGRTDWTQVAAAGVDEDDLEHPAPSVTVTAAAGDGHHHTDPAAATTGSDDDAAVPAGTDEGVAHDTATTTAASGAGGADGDDGTGLGIAGLVAGLLGLAAGLTALVRSARPRLPRQG